ncbi:MAG TPA: hypothetical protein VM889_01010 [Candidatus Thermoplasmatota archaeon]|nr:hypothetical protein [Candidatus Thermoplasmatota archaeon]
MTEGGTARRRWTVRVVSGVAGLLLFILALQLMRRGAGGLEPFVRDLLGVDDAASALGFGWAAAYLVMSGSPVAAISLTLFVSGILDDIQTFVMIAGSRLGASLIVLVVGFLYALRGRDRGASLQMGLLSLLVTYTIYVPAIVIGILLLESGTFDAVRLAPPAGLVDAIGLVYDPIVELLARRLPFWALFIAGAAAVVAALQVFDRALPDFEKRSPVRGVGVQIYRPAVMFALGFVVTLFTLSVSVSLGILVPLSAKGLVRRENVIPYIMGANVSTFIDTLFAALLLDAPRAFTIVLVEMVAVALVSVAVLVFSYDRYQKTMLDILDRILRSRATLAVFLAVILVLPFVLLRT